MAIVGARGPEDQERCVLLTHMVFDPLSSWPSFCLLGINFHPVPLVIPMTMSQSPVLRVRLGGLARGPEHRWPTHPQVGPLMEDINSTSQDVTGAAPRESSDDPKVTAQCLVSFQRDTLQKSSELIVESPGAQTEV